jgi:hypothetical protein
MQEMQQVIAAFSEMYPDVDMQIVNGNHEDLYEYCCSHGLQYASVLG